MKTLIKFAKQLSELYSDIFECEILPEYWNKLKQMQLKTDRTFRDTESIFDLEKRFKDE